VETVKRLNEGKKPVLRLPFHEIPGAYIIVSFQYGTISKAHTYTHTRYGEDYVPDSPLLTFFYGGDEVGAEWEPQYGPIMTYRKCKPDWLGETQRGSELKAKEHWFYDYVEDNALAWSQLAVDRTGLKQMLKDGDFVSIFGVLKSWTENRY
jgi:hypothetical protein